MKPRGQGSAPTAPRTLYSSPDAYLIAQEAVRTPRQARVLAGLAAWSNGSDDPTASTQKWCAMRRLFAARMEACGLVVALVRLGAGHNRPKTLTISDPREDVALWYCRGDMSAPGQPVSGRAWREADGRGWWVSVQPMPGRGINGAHYFHAMSEPLSLINKLLSAL